MIAKYPIALLLAWATTQSALSSTDARILLRYSTDDKADLIEEGILESTQFDGNEVSVTAASALDVGIITDDETAPRSICFEGSVLDAKKILETMIELTDGNGEHYLENMRVLKTGSGKISASFVVKNDRGNQKHELTIAACPPAPKK